MSTILVVDDDPHIRQVVCFALDKNGFSTVEASDGLMALEVAQRERPDLVVLDVAMPEMDGTEVCRRIRKTYDTPVIFLSSKDDEVDRIVGLEIGADDYVTKPFSPRELVARVKAVLRRQQGALKSVEPSASPATGMVRGLLRLDEERFEAHWDGRHLALTVTEFAVLRALAEHPARMFTRDMLMNVAYPDRRIVSDRTIDSHIRHLRAKLLALGAEPIETVHGLGYRFSDRQARQET
ncbi:two-component system response regulator CreB [Microvirga ossetica]|uniref:Two-component system response regulator CreB n=1 Tax=Microvirga ossetica TaxID=1882682 RepID=A0A1B2ENY1_9HYPH|nr:response regulator transcription factor [Microvirga ossetica]ANY81659.1 two-component system response regulator CreB [Microvirga ossetica]